MINENKHIINRKVLLTQNSHTVRSLAKAINYTPQQVNKAINGTSTSYRCHSRIAEYFGKTMVEIWPEIYGVVPDIYTVKSPVVHDSKVNEIKDIRPFNRSCS